MPLYNFECINCKKEYKKILKLANSKDIQLCKECGNALVRRPTPPTSRVTEFIDNGAMNKRLELIQDASIIMKERSKKKAPL